MIVSCHVPKTAGTTVRELLAEEFGRYFHTDYGDRVGWSGPEAEAWRLARSIPEQVMSAYRTDQLKCVHGHFYASKYHATFPKAPIVAFVRNPVDRVISNYRYLDRHPEIKHPLVQQFHSRKPTLSEWATWPWARNIQSKVLDIPFSQFRLVGITEQLIQSLRLFDFTFGTSISTRRQIRLNAAAGRFDIDEIARKRIAKLNEEDVAIYVEALEYFRDRACEIADIH